MAKKAKKKIAKRKSNVTGSAFHARFNDIRDQIDAVAKNIMKAKKFGGTRTDNAKERAHADAMLDSLLKARSYVLRECCHNDQSCTLFMLKPAKSAR